MLKIKLTAVLLLILTSISFAQQSDLIIGKYRLPNNLDIEIFKSQNRYFGRIIALNGFENGQLKDYKNPDKLKQNDKLIGKIIINDLEFNEDANEWVNGKMYGPEKGMVFDLKITKIMDQEIRVYGSKYFFRKSMLWKKI